MRIKSVRLTNYKRFASLTLTNIPESARLVVLLGQTVVANHLFSMRS